VLHVLPRQSAAAAAAAEERLPCRQAAFAGSPSLHNTGVGTLGQEQLKGGAWASVLAAQVRRANLVELAGSTNQGNTSRLSTSACRLTVVCSSLQQVAHAADARPCHCIAHVQRRRRRCAIAIKLLLLLLLLLSAVHNR